MLSLSLTDIVLYGREMSIWRWVGNFDACILLFIATSTTLSYKMCLNIFKRKVNIDFSGDSIYSCNSVSKLDQFVYVLCMVADNLYSVVYPTLFLMSWHHHFSKLKLCFSAISTHSAKVFNIFFNFHGFQPVPCNLPQKLWQIFVSMMLLFYIQIDQSERCFLFVAVVLW